MVGRDPQRKRRRSIRLKGYDYSQPGAHFVTNCAQQGECLFGQVADGQMQLSDAGRMVEAVWYELPDRYPGVESDAFVVMPNHVHGIVVLTDDPADATVDGDRVGATPRGRPYGELVADGEKGRARGSAPTMAELVADGEKGQARGPAPTWGRMSLPDVVHRFKSFTTAGYRHGARYEGWPPFPRRLWQRNYWEHVIRDEEALRKIREYIESNPARWEEDRMHPDAPTNPWAGRAR